MLLFTLRLRDEYQRQLILDMFVPHVQQAMAHHRMLSMVHRLHRRNRAHPSLSEKFRESNPSINHNEPFRLGST
jgi:hypothetical protein